MGGYYDDCGVCALMARQVKHLYIFMFDGCLDPDHKKPDEGTYPMSLQQIFVWKIGKLGTWGPGFLEDDDKHTGFWKVVDTLDNLKDSLEPAIYTSNYITKTVPEAGITPYNVKITWIIPIMEDIDIPESAIKGHTKNAW